MNKEILVNMIRSFRFLAVTIKMNKADITELESELNELKKLCKTSINVTRVDDILLDIVSFFRSFDLGYEAYEIVRDAIKIQDSGAHEISKAINRLERDLDSICENLGLLVNSQKQIRDELVSSNLTSEMTKVVEAVVEVSQELREVRGSIANIAYRQ